MRRKHTFQFYIVFYTPRELNPSFTPKDNVLNDSNPLVKLTPNLIYALNIAKFQMLEIPTVKAEVLHCIAK